jgi:hypothetical protein
LTLTIFPAIVTAPVRDKVDVFAGAVTTTVPLAVPLLPLVTVNQVVLVAAVQPQFAPAVTEKLVEPPFAAMVLEEGDTVNVQDDALWVTETVCPATVRLPLRDDDVVFAAAV